MQTKAQNLPLLKTHSRWGKGTEIKTLMPGGGRGMNARKDDIYMLTVLDYLLQTTGLTILQMLCNNQ